MNGADKPAEIIPCERYFWRSHPLNQFTGSDIFATLFQPQTRQPGPAGIATLLESPYPLPPDSLPEAATAMARYSICAGPPRVTEGQVQLWTPTIGHVLSLLHQLDSVGQVTVNKKDITQDVVPPNDLPFAGGWLGWLGYDVAWEIERLPWLKEDQLPFPVAFWYEPAEFAVLDHHLQQLWLAAETPARVLNMVALLKAQITTHSDEKRNNQSYASIYIDKKRLDQEHLDQEHLDKEHLARRSPQPFANQPAVTKHLWFDTGQTEFEQAVRKAKSHIRAGDVFQVNHSLRFQAQTTLPSWEVYKTLHRINPSPFASYWHTPWGSVVSCSPERLVHLRDGIAQSRPIAGTRPRGQGIEDDASIAQELKGDRKEQAEHIMLVDLERNDLGRVCQWGSVNVAELMTIERYSHVMHLVSNVVGNLQPDKTVAQLVAALFPGGTITGCPKVRCMEIIESLEPVRRSLFYGSCGYLDRRGYLDLNILIRTLLLSAPPTQIPKEPQNSAFFAANDVALSSPCTVWGQVGAGIVADSDPEREWWESLQKAKAQLLALGL